MKSGDIRKRTKRVKSVKIQMGDAEDEIEFLNIVIINKDSKISRLEKELLNKNSHIQNIWTRLSEQVESFVIVGVNTMFPTVYSC